MPILKMASSEWRNYKTIGAQILCSVSFQPDMRNQLAEQGAIYTLADIFKWILQTSNKTFDTELLRLVIVTIGQLSNFPEFNQQILDSGIFSQLFEFAVDGNYKNAQMRRACGQTIANISERFPNQVIESVEQRILISWLDHIPTITDKVIKDYGERVYTIIKPLL